MESDILITLNRLLVLSFKEPIRIQSRPMLFFIQHTHLTNDIHFLVNQHQVEGQPVCECHSGNPCDVVDTVFGRQQSF